MHLELFYNKKNPINNVSQKFDNYEEEGGADRQSDNQNNIESSQNQSQLDGSDSFEGSQHQEQVSQDMIQGDDGHGSVGTQDTRQIKILLADDESFNLILLESMIQEIFPNAVIEQAMNGKLAFDCVKAAD